MHSINLSMLQIAAEQEGTVKTKSAGIVDSPADASHTTALEGSGLQQLK